MCQQKIGFKHRKLYKSWKEKFKKKVNGKLDHEQGMQIRGDFYIYQCLSYGLCDRDSTALPFQSCFVIIN